MSAADLRLARALRAWVRTRGRSLPLSSDEEGGVTLLDARAEPCWLLAFLSELPVRR